jgi:hypothetical protein
MIKTNGLAALAVLACLIGGPALSQDTREAGKSNIPKNADGKTLERAEQVRRDSAGLERIHRIALVPVITQVRFDRGSRLPDPSRLRASAGALAEVPAILESSLPSRKYEFVSGSTVDQALQALHFQPLDLYMTRTTGTWDSPAETIQGGKKDEAVLLAKRDDFKGSPQDMTLFRFSWHDSPEAVTGLASFELGAFAPINTDKAKQLASKLKVDALLFLAIADVEVHEGTTGFSVFTKRFKSTRTHIYGSLLSAPDGGLLWQGRARGVKSHKVGYFYVGRMKGELNKSVAEGAADAIQILLSDLYEGTGVPTHK